MSHGEYGAHKYKPATVVGLVSNSGPSHIVCRHNGLTFSFLTPICGALVSLESFQNNLIRSCMVLAISWSELWEEADARLRIHFINGC